MERYRIFGKLRKLTGCMRKEGKRMIKLKKLLAIGLAAAMTMSMTAMSSFAANGAINPADSGDYQTTTENSTTNSTADAGKGQITVDNPIDGKTYRAYKLFDVAYDADKDAFAYTIDADTAETSLYQHIITGASNPDLSSYFKLTLVPGTTGKYYVEPADTNGLSETTVAAFAKALQQAMAADPKTIDLGTAVTFTKDNDDNMSTAATLPLGYYFITTTTGSLCSLDTTANHAVVLEKNEEPSIDKTVQEDSLVTGAGDGDGKTAYQKQNDAEVGQTIYYKTVIDAKAGAYKYVLADKMSEGLTFDNKSLKIYVVPATQKGKLVGTETPVAASTNGPGELKNGNTLVATFAVGVEGAYKKDEDATAEDATFTLVFDNDWLANNFTDATKQIIVTYEAALNENAEIKLAHTNDTVLTYGDDNYTSESGTKTFVWGLDITKFTNTNVSTSKNLAGAKFVLYKVVDGKIYLANFTGTSPNYVLASTPTTAWIAAGDNVAEAGLLSWAESDFTNKGTLLESNTAGKIYADKLDAGTYKLLEVTPPVGYNKLAEAIEVQVDSNSDKDDEGTTKPAETITTSLSLHNEGDIEDGRPEYGVVNKTGTELPSTGGIGTTIFYVIGSILVVGAGLVLVAKRRMSMN